MFKIYKDTKIYVYCRSGVVTGGPEAVHQLVDKLRRLGHNALIIYYPNSSEPKPKEYTLYNTISTTNVEDEGKNILITLEVWPELLDRYKKIQKGIWWLSVDNAQKKSTFVMRKINNIVIRFHLDKFKIFSLIQSKGLKVYHKIKSRGEIFFKFNSKKNVSIIHLAQSKYAEEFLRAKGAKFIYLLHDYLNSSHFKGIKMKKEDIILYNPTKGKEITDKLIGYAPYLNWKPIQNLKPYEVAEVMAKSKVYIDFGSHPGKDRMPREAAIKECCVIVGLRGSACFQEDMPIPQEYKFSIDPLDAKSVMTKIKDCLINYETRKGDFEEYKDIIQLNEKIFEMQIRYLFEQKNEI